MLRLDQIRGRIHLQLTGFIRPREVVVHGVGLEIDFHGPVDRTMFHQAVLGCLLDAKERRELLPLESWGDTRPDTSDDLAAGREEPSQRWITAQELGEYLLHVLSRSIRPFPLALSPDGVPLLEPLVVLQLLCEGIPEVVIVF